MPAVAGQKLWNRVQFTLTAGETKLVPHGLEQVHTTTEQPFDASIMIIPLPRIVAWTDIEIGAIDETNVEFINVGVCILTVNVLFWQPHTFVGGGDTMPYTGSGADCGGGDNL